MFSVLYFDYWQHALLAHHNIVVLLGWDNILFLCFFADSILDDNVDLSEPTPEKKPAEKQEVSFDNIVDTAFCDKIDVSDHNQSALV